MNNQDREQGSSVPKPLSPADSALKFIGTGGKFHLTCVVFCCSVLRKHIIQISYLHYVGFTNSKARSASTPLLSSEQALLGQSASSTKIWVLCNGKLR